MSKTIKKICENLETAIETDSSLSDALDEIRSRMNDDLLQNRFDLSSCHRGRRNSAKCVDTQLEDEEKDFEWVRKVHDAKLYRRLMFFKDLEKV